MEPLTDLETLQLEAETFAVTAEAKIRARGHIETVLGLVDDRDRATDSNSNSAAALEAWSL
jgi:hypothetical protein